MTKATHGFLKEGVRAQKSSGFALLITITLVAFLVLLLVSLASLTRIETQTGAQSNQLSQAQQNALLGLETAIGQLQRFAGPDQRVTARSDISSATIANPHWTGVWDVTSGTVPTNPMVWLVSGSETTLSPQPTTNYNRKTLTAPEPMTVNATTGKAALSGGGRVPLVNAGSAGSEDWLSVPAVPIDGFVPGFSADRTTGRYAYWVGDEGVKAHVALVEPAAVSRTEATGMTTVDAREMRRLAGPAQLGARAIFPSADTSVDSWQEVLSDEQLQLVGTQVSSSEAKARFHDSTTVSQGVLAHTLTPTTNGWLRRDLSRGIAGGESGAPPASMVAYAANQATPIAGNGVVSTIEPDSIFHPILAELRLKYTIGIVAGGGALELVPEINAALYNPYVAVLGASDLRYEIAVSGLPVFNPGDLVVNGTAVPEVVDLNTVLSGYQFAATRINPGRTMLLADASGLTVSGSVLGNVKLGVASAGNPIPLTATIGPAPGGVQSISLTTTSTPTVSVTLRVYSRDPSTGTEAATPTDLLTQTFTYAVSAAPLTGTSTVEFGLRLAVNDDPAAWLQVDPRSTAPTLLAPVAWDAATALGAIAADPANANATLFGNNRSEPYTIVFDTLRSDLPLFSVGQLRHAPNGATAPWPLGSSAGGNLNELYDHYFFSTVPSSWTITNWEQASDPPNPRMELYSQGQTAVGNRWKDRDLAASALLERGMFNANSTSYYAWAAALRSSHGADPTLYIPGDATNPVRGRSTLTPTRAVSFSAFPKSAGSSGVGFYDIASSSSQPTLRSLWQTGYRELKPLYLDEGAVTPTGSTATTREFTEDNARALALRLGDNIARRLRQRGKPFGSVAELVNSGLIADTIENTTAPIWSWTGTAITPEGRAASDTGTAIAPVPSRRTSGGLNQYRSSSSTFADIPAGSPAFLRQADIIATLAPMLTVRSDTFRVRSFGEKINPATGAVDARAWCEAIVQRVPEPAQPVDPTNISVSEYQRPPGNFGRRFEVVSLRWLSETDL